MRWRVGVLVGVFLVQTLGLSWLAAPEPARGAGGGVYISELQTNGAASGQSNYEFVELYNASETDISLHGWQLEYRAASTSNGTDCTKGWKTVPFPDGAIKAHHYYLLADKNYPIVADARFSLDMAATAGTVHILDSNKHVIDSLAWGDGSSCGAGAAATMASGQSLERLPGISAPFGGNGYDTGNNQNDFALRATPEPQTSLSPAETPMIFTDLSQPGASSQLKLSELLINPGAGQTAYVEFHNDGQAAIVLSAYMLRIGSASYYLPHQVLAAGAYGMVTADTFPLSLPADAGEVDLLDGSGTQVDGVTWLAAPSADGLIPGSTGWDWTAKPTPGRANELVVPSQTTAPQTNPAGDGLGGSLTIYPEVQITELLPDPASPATDATDEFIELYNPNGYAVNIAGYVLKTGHTLSDHFTLPSLELPAGGYAAFTSGQTRLALSNSGSSVALFDPLGEQVGETIGYETAKTGDTWAKFGSGWAWTTTPTPDAANILTAPVAIAGKVAAATTAKKAKTATAAKAAKAGVVKSAKPKAAAKPKKTKSVLAAAKPALAAATSGPWLLVILVGLTICYCIYEFRYDLRNFYHKLRGYSGGSRQVGAASKERRDDRASQRSGRRQDDVRPGADARARL